MLGNIINFVVVLFYMLLPLQINGTRMVYKIQKGTITFVSEAPLEIITAQSDELRGIIDPVKNTFAFSVAVLTFHGFNGPLQKEHFNENYLESKNFPVSTFTGKIIEDIDYTKNGIYEVRAKGVLNIHGVKQERIIKSNMEIKDSKITVKSSFTVTLEDHEIRIPKIVFQKIAREIKVDLHAAFILTEVE